MAKERDTNDGAGQTEGSPDEQAGLIIILVHGTWGAGFFRNSRRRKPRWFEKAGAFYVSLSQELTHRGVAADFRQLIWSGSNSISARDLASRSLAGELDRLQATSPKATKVVIGHSHGGNVAIQSLSYISPTTPRPMIIAIATPFLKIFEWKRNKTNYIMAALAFFMILQSLLVAFGGVLERASESIAELPYLYYPTLAVQVVLSIFLLQMMLALMELFGAEPTKGYGKKLAKLRLQTSAHSFSNGSPPTLMLRGTDDEATLTLSLGLILTRLSRLLFTVITPVFLLGRILPTVIETLFRIPRWPSDASDRAAISACVQSSEFLEKVGSPLLKEALRDYEFASCVNSVLDILSVWPPIILAVIIVGISVALSTFGRELFFGGLFCEVNLSSAPDGRGCFEIRTLGETRSRRRLLRHKLYDNVECAPTIAGWISQKETKRSRRLR
ncbi:esterase/lipase family protein [Rhizobium ruizarguesonis]